MKYKYFKLLIILIVTIFILLMTGCNKLDINKEEDIHEINMSAIEHVLKNSLTCPSLTSLEDINPSTEGVSIVGNSNNTISEKSEKNPIGEELKSIYEPYFTENYYAKFIGTHAMTFEVVALRAGYEIKVDSINITPKENDMIGYDFKVNLTYWKDIAEKSTAEITGTAQCLEEGKISYINYFGDGGLLKNMTYNRQEYHSFPPDEEDLTLALKESGLNWKIQENKYHTTDSDLPNPFAIHNISDSSGLVDCWINMRYYLPPDDKTASITFSYNEQTSEDYDRFQKEDWPLFWLLAGKLFQSPEEITQLGEQCMSYYENYIGKEQEILDWKGKQGDVYCMVRFMWHPLLEQYVLDGIYLDNSLSYNSEMSNEALTAYSFPIDISDFENKIIENGWIVEQLEGYDDARSHFKLKKEDGIMAIIETLGYQGERFISANFYSGDKLSEVGIKESSEGLFDTFTLFKDFYGINQDINELFNVANNLSNRASRRPLYTWSKRINDDVVIYNFKQNRDDYNLTRLSIMNIESYENYILGLASVLDNNIGNNKYLQVSDLSDEVYRNGEIYQINGKLNNVVELTNDISYVKTADIIDKTGSKEVILFQNAFTNKELNEDRTHYIFYDELVSEYVIMYSVIEIEFLYCH